MTKGQEFIYAKLTADTVIASLASDILYGWQEEEVAFPCVTFFEVSSTPRQTRDTFEETYQIDVWDYAGSVTALDAIAERIFTIFDFAGATTGVFRTRVTQIRESFEGDLRRKSIDIQLFATL